MPKAMTEAEIDPIAEALDQQMMESGEPEQVPQHKVDLSANFGDLSNGGRVGRAEVIPVGESGRVVFDKRLREPGRPTVRMVWLWNGTPSTIPLAYEPSGKRHDGGRKYLLKRHCPTCRFTGFYGSVCPACRKDGREIGPVMPAYYLKKELVPKSQQYFGAVDCLVPTCIRRGKWGFLTEADMRQHAMGKHRMEYRAFQDSAQSNRDTEIMQLRSQVAALMTQQLNSVKPSGPNEAQREKMRQAWAKRKAKKAAAGNAA